MALTVPQLVRDDPPLALAPEPVLQSASADSRFGFKPAERGQVSSVKSPRNIPSSRQILVPRTPRDRSPTDQIIPPSEGEEDDDENYYSKGSDNDDGDEDEEDEDDQGNHLSKEERYEMQLDPTAAIGLILP